jgi:hypothetical protein
MEIIRDLLLKDLAPDILSRYYGTIDALVNDREFYKSSQFVLKPAEGSMSKGVSSASKFNDLHSLSKKISRTGNIRADIKDFFRKYKHKGYIPDSRYRKKFVVQNLVKELSGDWKVLIFGSKYYVLKRENRKDDFRASGGGRLSYTMEVPPGLLDFSEKLLGALNVPNLSLDIGFSENKFYLFEFQCLYFGSYTLEYSEFYFVKNGNDWTTVPGKSVLEEEYCRSISAYIESHLQKDR